MFECEIEPACKKRRRKNEANNLYPESSLTPWVVVQNKSSSVTNCFSKTPNNYCNTESWKTITNSEHKLSDCANSKDGE